MNKVLIIGAGRSGEAAAKLLRREGCEVTLSDVKGEAELKGEYEELREIGVELRLGEQDKELLRGVDMVVLSPSVPRSLELLEECSVPIIGEVELAYVRSASPIVAVTGTNGKTTTVTLIGELCKSAYKKVGVGGNIGVPLCDVVREVGAGGLIVAEISSFQLETVYSFRPKVAAILNLTPDHIKRHGSFEVYREMKERIFRKMCQDDRLVLNYDDEQCRQMKNEARCKVYYFSRKVELEEGAFVVDGEIVLRFEGEMRRLGKVKDLKIKGEHNVENVLAAVLCAYLVGVRDFAALWAFRGVEHRIEFVLKSGGVQFYNDSKATNVDSAIKALRCFEGKVVWIAGGRDKGTDLSELMRVARGRCEHIVLIGEAEERFREAALEAGFDEAQIHLAGYSMFLAVTIATRLCHGGEVVLLSPACASFDMYEGFEERGRHFKRIVRRGEDN